MIDRLSWVLRPVGGRAMRLALGQVLCSVALLAAPAVAQDSARGQVTAFVGVSVVPMDRERVLARQTVLVRDGTIAAIGRVGQVRVPAGAVRIDGRGKFLLPGFGNMHAHLQVDAMTDSMPDSATVERILRFYLADGVTTVRNLNGRPWHVTLRDEVARGARIGPRIYTSGPVLGNEVALPDPAAAVQAVEAQHAVGYDFLKVYDQPFSVETFDSLAAAAKRAGMPMAGHTPRIVGLERVLQARFASIEHLSGYLEYLGELNAPGSVAADTSWNVFERDIDFAPLRPVIEATKRAGVSNAPTLTALERVTSGRNNSNFQARLRARLARMRAMSDSVVRALHAADAELLLSTDGGPQHEISIVEELELLVAAGLTPYDALATGTRNVARFLGTLDSTGTVEVGKRADLVLLEGNPLADVRRVAQRAGVMVAGHWLPRAELKAYHAAKHD